MEISLEKRIELDAAREESSPPLIHKVGDSSRYYQFCFLAVEVDTSILTSSIQELIGTTSLYEGYMPIFTIYFNELKKKLELDRHWQGIHQYDKCYFGVEILGKVRKDEVPRWPIWAEIFAAFPGCSFPQEFEFNSIILANTHLPQNIHNMVGRYHQGWCKFVEPERTEYFRMSDNF